ncbi:MAG: DUF1905 domain-containing protein [Candidatus Limnocylindrales bacterium]
MTAKLGPMESGTFVVIPADVVEAFRATGRTSVVGTIEGQPFRNQFMPYTLEGVGRQVVMAVSKATRDAIGKVAGDTVDFDLDRDERPRSADVEFPVELAEALAADSAAASAFRGARPVSSPRAGRTRGRGQATRDASPARRRGIAQLLG